MSPILYRSLVVAFLVVIIGSLFSALLFLLKDKGSTERTVKALTVRIGVSITLFGLLMAGFYFGVLPPKP
ncbi:twin transmembrane helix small protein [Thiobacter aerophilum]|uniref:Twin transmembrane helix small protein n=1 Tax=Thiobacter aerophilum TaxID=3121275 RepID=A0ABV0EEB8_9BURK